MPHRYFIFALGYFTCEQVLNSSTLLSNPRFINLSHLYISSKERIFGVACEAASEDDV